MAKISIIVPVYKVEKYLSRCIDSILNQTYSNFELILVDDGSPDRCGELCEEYAFKDTRIHVIHRENGGLSAARNTGIDWVFANSESEYLTFIDSDDWIHPQYLELLLKEAEKYNVPVSICGFERPDSLEECLMLHISKYTSKKMDAETLLVEYVWNFNYAWGKLYSKEFFEDIRYPEGKNFEDTFTTYKVLFQCEQVVLIENALYFYFKNEEGITRSPWNPKELVIFEAMQNQMKFYKENGYMRAFEKEEYLYLNHFAYQISRIRANKNDSKKNKLYVSQLRKEMMQLVRQNPNKFGYKKMPQCYEAAYPNLMKVYHKVGAFIRMLRKLVKE